MPNTSVYTFEDVIVTVVSPLALQYIAEGVGLDSVSIDYANDNSEQNVAADGTVVTSKIVAQNGNVILAMQQTSGFHKWLQNWFSLHYNPLAVALWASTTIVVASPLTTQEIFRATGVSPSKRATQPFQKNVQNVNWTLPAANITPYAPSLNPAALLSVSATIGNTI